jgi:hypothetical protein
MSVVAGVPPAFKSKAADTAASTVPIREIRDLPRRSSKAKGLIRGLRRLSLAAAGRRRIFSI